MADEGRTGRSRVLWEATVAPDIVIGSSSFTAADQHVWYRAEPGGGWRKLFREQKNYRHLLINS